MTRWLLVLAGLAACSDDEVDPITKITGPRVLAIVTEPSVLAADGSIELVPLTVDELGPRLGVGTSTPPGGRPVDDLRVRACAPWRFIAEPGRDCAGADALPLATAGDGRFTVSTEQLLAAFPPPPDLAPPGTELTVETLRAALAAGLELRVPVVAEVDVDGETLVARRDLLVVAEVGELENPRIAEVRFDGVPLQTLRSGQRYTLTVAIDPDSIDEPLDQADVPEPELEDLDCNMYSPTGELAEREVDVDEPELSTESEPNAYTPGEPGETWLYVVVTDRTGGMTADWVPLVIE